MKDEWKKQMELHNREHEARSMMVAHLCLRCDNPPAKNLIIRLIRRTLRW
jgi:hypothetical protein